MRRTIVGASGTDARTLDFDTGLSNLTPVLGRAPIAAISTLAVNRAKATTTANLNLKQTVRAENVAAGIAQAHSIATAPWNTANVDWGTLAKLPAVIAAGVAIAATGGVAAGVLGLTAGTALTASTLGAAGLKALSDLKSDPLKATLALPGLALDAKAKVDSVKVTADRLIAGAESGSSVSADVYATTRAQALAGNPDAIKAIEILSSVASARAAAGVPLGQPSTLNAAGNAALAAFPVLMAGATIKLTAPAPAPATQAQAAALGTAAFAGYAERMAAAAAAAAPAVAGQLVHSDGALSGRLNFSAMSWRPCAASTPGAVRGLVITPAGRVAFESTDWTPA